MLGVDPKLDFIILPASIYMQGDVRAVVVE